MIVVIGATGFIGMYTVDELIKAGKDVVATGRNEPTGREAGRYGSSVRSLGYDQA